MSEHLKPRDAERAHHNGEIEKAAAERLRSIEKSSERPKPRHESVEVAREQISKAETPNPYEAATKAEPKTVVTREASYRHTVMSIQHRLKPASRKFSKFIHHPMVDATSEVLGKTVLRPSVSLGATTTAVLFTGFLYLTARTYGFELRGSEIWISLLLGGVIGLLVEFIFKLLRRARG